ncbi:MAG TPA: glycine C-acetyltransferase, partial [candidate division Zixibacteria bacterium]|nr:glycine C-acetyltransferase [candidate division Zixibacteria bacterium]
KKLEAKIAEFLGMEDTILYSSCFDANGGLFETLLDENDAVISDALNHASIIDGIRLCKAERRRFAHNDMNDLEKHLKDTQNKKVRMVATDGVFSMDGDIARLKDICDLAEKYDAMVMVDDSHATGFVGDTGRGSYEFRGVEGRIDIITSTLGKALGGASGGFTSGKKKLIELLRQRSRPYLFSNTVAPVVVGVSMEVLEMLTTTSDLRQKLNENTKYFREKMTDAGFDIREGIHPIVPIMLGEARLAKNIASDMFKEGIYVIGFSFPVVPRGQARIRVQLSAAHEKEHLDKAINAFVKIGKKYDIIGKKMDEIVEMFKS